MSDREPDQIDREQVETALKFLEWSHGDALSRPWSDEAYAYYNAIDILEAALNGDLRPPDEICHTEREQEYLQQSREAREEGYAAATLLDERYGGGSVEPDKREGGIVAALKRVFA